MLREESVKLMGSKDEVWCSHEGSVPIKYRREEFVSRMGATSYNKGWLLRDVPPMPKEKEEFVSIMVQR